LILSINKKESSTEPSYHGISVFFPYKTELYGMQKGYYNSQIENRYRDGECL